MRKTLVILIVSVTLGILATYVTPSSPSVNNKTNSNTTAPTGTSTSTTMTNTNPTSSDTTNTPVITSPTIGQYKNGTYNGNVSSNGYDNIQVSIVVSGGKITDILTPVLDGSSYHSTSINNYAAPLLKQEALNAQSAAIDAISGASYTSQSYIESLQSAIDQAKI